MLGLVSVLRQILAKLTDVITQLSAIASATGTIAVNTTPAEDTEPAESEP